MGSYLVNFSYVGAVMFKLLVKNAEMIFFIVVCGFSLSGNSAAKGALYNQLKVIPGDYEKTQGDLEKCQADVVDLAWEGDESNKVLRLGQKFIFAHLEQTSFVAAGMKSCNSKTVTSLSEKIVSQLMSNECPDKKKSDERMQTLKIDGNKLTFEYEVKNNSKFNFKCEYVKLKK